MIRQGKPKFEVGQVVAYEGKTYLIEKVGRPGGDAYNPKKARKGCRWTYLLKNVLYGDKLPEAPFWKPEFALHAVTWSIVQTGQPQSRMHRTATKIQLGAAKLEREQDMAEATAKLDANWRVDGLTRKEAEAIVCMLPGLITVPRGQQRMYRAIQNKTYRGK